VTRASKPVCNSSSLSFSGRRAGIGFSTGTAWRGSKWAHCLQAVKASAAFRADALEVRSRSAESWRNCKQREATTVWTSRGSLGPADVQGWGGGRSAASPPGAVAPGYRGRIRNSPFVCTCESSSMEDSALLWSLVSRISGRLLHGSPGISHRFFPSQPDITPITASPRDYEGVLREYQRCWGAPGRKPAGSTSPTL